MTSLGATLDCTSICGTLSRSLGDAGAPRGTSQVEFTPGLVFLRVPFSRLFPARAACLPPKSERPAHGTVIAKARDSPDGDRLPRILAQVPVRLPTQRTDHGPREHAPGVVLSTRQCH